MKINSNLLGKVVAFVNIDEVLPQGGTHVPEALSAVIERYAFNIAPSLSDPIQKTRDNGFKFETGRFASSDGNEHLIQEFTIWPDGLVVSGYTTDEAEAFLDDFSQWGRKTLGFRVNLAALNLRAYLSQLVVEFDHSLVRAFSVLQPICTAFDNALRKTYDTEFPSTEPVTIRLDYDHAVAPAAFKVLGPFIVERRENHRFTEDNFFFSQAPLRTEDHLSLLAQFEAILVE
jgi:hypothetical protein